MTELAQVASTAHELESKYANAFNEARTYKIQNETLQSEIVAMQAVILQKSQELETYFNENNEQSKLLNQQTTEIDQLKSDNNELTTTANNLREVVSLRLQEQEATSLRTESEFEMLSNELHAMNSELEEYRNSEATKHIAQLQNQCYELEAQLKNLSSEYEQSHTQNTKANDLCSVLAAKLEATQFLLESRNEEVETLRQELDPLGEILGNKTQQLAHAACEIESLKQKLSTQPPPPTPFSAPKDDELLALRKENDLLKNQLRDTPSNTKSTEQLLGNLTLENESLKGLIHSHLNRIAVLEEENRASLRRVKLLETENRQLQQPGEHLEIENEVLRSELHESQMKIQSLAATLTRSHSEKQNLSQHTGDSEFPITDTNSGSQPQSQYQTDNNNDDDIRLELRDSQLHIQRLTSELTSLRANLPQNKQTPSKHPTDTQPTPDVREGEKQPSLPSGEREEGDVVASANSDTRSESKQSPPHLEGNETTCGFSDSIHSPSPPINVTPASSVHMSVNDSPYSRDEHQIGEQINKILECSRREEQPPTNVELIERCHIPVEQLEHESKKLQAAIRQFSAAPSRSNSSNEQFQPQQATGDWEEQIKKVALMQHVVIS
eukprot:TRINITY_DN17015_c0_g1_i2.p1 TRINITY_DN17015_c0_g1~~TRINITY_DN17015_c0_g1_i2.p1  ORF type:complete len:707 (+),score=214.32 TRINITY_DN17015_c0_g1_i2:287-2122(+)